MKILNYVFVITLFIQTSCMDKNKFVVFDNTPHKQYMGLKEKVRDVQITFFREEIEEQGYKLSEPVSLFSFLSIIGWSNIQYVFLECYSGSPKRMLIYIFHLWQFIRHNFWSTNVVNGMIFHFRWTWFFR